MDGEVRALLGGANTDSLENAEIGPASSEENAPASGAGTMIWRAKRQLALALEAQRSAEEKAELERSRAATLETEIQRLQQQAALALEAQHSAEEEAELERNRAAGFEAEAMLQRSRATTLESDVSRLLASTSWRITAPLRAVKRLISGKA